MLLSATGLEMQGCILMKAYWETKFFSLEGALEVKNATKVTFLRGELLQSLFVESIN